MKKTLLIIVLLLGGCSINFAQKKARIFAKDIISKGNVFAITFTPDGKTIYFCESTPDRSIITIQYSHLKNGKWTPPQPASFSDKGRNIDPYISPDGNTMVFNSNRKRSNDTTNYQFDIWISQKKEEGWGEPVNIGLPVNTINSESFATIARNGNLYYGTRLPNSTSQHDIYRARYRNGKYETPERLAIVNTNEDEGNPFIEADEKFLIFSVSNKEGGFGDSDLYISFNNNGEWTVPQNMGDQVNSEDAEFAPTVTPDGKYLYFSRIKRPANFNSKNPPNGKYVDSENIYYISLKELAVFKNREK
ncbi:MAG: PD40 domain-containing protein [Chitinophagaceae bacterium]|nr:PD40 domain-containing protein [Chitinophagaceae bacterium]